MLKSKKLLLIPLSFFLINCALAEKITITVQSLGKKNGADQTIGTIMIEDSQFGLMFTPDLKALPPGVHGFHVHTNPSCKKSGKEAGPHYDPAKTDLHGGPYYLKGHLGDLPALIVNKDGTAKLPVLAPRLALTDLKKRSLIIHEKSDDYQDSRKKDGGGGKKIACAIIGQSVRIQKQ